MMLTEIANFRIIHCIKSVCIRSYSVPYSVRMRENTDQTNSEYGHFSRSDSFKAKVIAMHRISLCETVKKKNPELIFSSSIAKSSMSNNEKKEKAQMFLCFTNMICENLCDICPHTEVILMTSKCA